MEEKEKKPGFFKRLVSGLTKTRDNIVSGIDSLFSGFSHIDDDFYEELEEILIMGDLGVRATESIIEDLQRKVKEKAQKKTWTHLPLWDKSSKIRPSADWDKPLRIPFYPHWITSTMKIWNTYGIRLVVPSNVNHY